MTESEAIIARHSVRQYLDKPIEAEKIEAIQECIDHCNREGGVHIQLIANEPKAFSSLIGYAHLDLGIAKYHFEVGAGDNFSWV